MSEKPIMLTNPDEINLNEDLKLIQAQINNKKWEVVRMRLKAMKLLHVLKNLDKQRFPKIMIEIDKETGNETVYANDGTLKGKRIVTFLGKSESELKDKDFKMQLKYI